MSNDFTPAEEGTNILEVESSKQYKKNSKQTDDLITDNSPHGLPVKSSTPYTKNKSNLKQQEPKSTIVRETLLSRNHVPKISICPNKYTPMLYTFRVPCHDSTNVSMGKAQRPPYCLLLDNAIAVVWCLFSKNPTPKPLGKNNPLFPQRNKHLSELQWALSFLETIVNRRGEHPKDVNVCITTIRDQLIDLYADLVNELQSPKDKKQKAKKKSSKQVINEAEEPQQTSAAAKPKKPEHVTYDDSYMKNMPFSLNYNDIVNTSQKSTTTYGVDATKSGKSLNQGQSKDELTSFLHSWKQEQIDKIQAELQRLHSIENFIGNCEKNNAQPYLGDKELHVLLAEKNKRNTTM